MLWVLYLKYNLEELNMAEITTKYRRENLCKITSGAIAAMPAITHIAFGDGGVDGSGTPLEPTDTQTALKHEIARYPIEKKEYPVSTTARYTVTIGKDELVGGKISEAALIDADGKLCAIKNMFVKQKDADVSFTFAFDDEF